MNTSIFHIDVPIWHSRSVGLASDKVTDTNIVFIDYLGKDGRPAYPTPFTIDGTKVRSYPTQPAKRDPSIKLFIVPIAALSLPEGETVGRLVLFSGEEIEITHKQYERIMKLLDDNSSQYIEVENRGIKKSNISLVEGDEPANPTGIDRSPEAMKKQMERHRRMLNRKTKDI